MRQILTLAWVVWLEMLRRKDFYVLLILLLVFLGALLMLNVFGLGRLVIYIKEIGLLLIWGASWILATALGARQLPQEETRGTVFALLAKPVRRGQVLLGKWLGVWLGAVAATTLFYGILLVVVLARGGALNGLALAQALGLHFVFLGLLAAMAIAFSTRLHADAAAVMTYVVSLSAWLVLPRAPDLALHARGLGQTGLMLVYYLLPHLEVLDMRRRLIYDWPPAAGSAVALALTYGACWTALILFLGWLGYRKRRFARGTIM